GEHDNVRLRYAGKIQGSTRPVRSHQGDERVAEALRRGLKSERNEVSREPGGRWRVGGIGHRVQHQPTSDGGQSFAVRIRFFEAQSPIARLCRLGSPKSTK